MAKAEAPAGVAKPVLRGSVERATDHMEVYQAGYVRAIAAAAGCVPSWMEIDEGVDLALTHRSPHHTVGDKVARLEVQMKATSATLTAGSTHVSARMKRERYNEFIVPNPTIHKIIVVLSMPLDPKNLGDIRERVFAYSSLCILGQSRRLRANNG